MAVVAAALPGGKLQLMDIYGNFLVEFTTEDGDEIIELQSNPRGMAQSEDMFVAALTESGALYVFSFEMTKVENWKEIQKAQKSNVDTDGDERFAPLNDFPYSKNYRQLIH